MALGNEVSPSDSGRFPDAGGSFRDGSGTDNADLATRIYDQPATSVTGVSSKRFKRGDTFGRYVVVDEIGKGGMGVVYRAYDPELERTVAVKVLSDSIRSGSDSTMSTRSARLAREAQALAKLSHPNVLPIFDVGVVDGRMFMATEYVEGVTLKEWMSSEIRSWRAVVTCLAEAGRGLVAAHEVGIVHRDFKPGNVIVDPQGHARVLDFGIARRNEEPTGVGRTRDVANEIGNGVESMVSQDLTAEGAVLGTPSYMAPEQHAGASADAAADQYAFCVSLYQGLYGQLPFARGPHQLRAKQTLHLDPVHMRRPVPLWLRKVVLRGLAPDPSKRWPSMAALLRALDRDPRRTALRVSVGFVALATALTGGWAYGQAREARAQLCSGGPAQVSKVWNDDRRTQIERAFLATKANYAAETWSRAQALLDEYSDAWTFAHRDVCEATHIRGEQSSRVLDLRMACLEGRLRDLEALTDVFIMADETVVQKAVSALHGLPDMEICTHRDAQTAVIQPPPTAQRADVDSVRASIAQVNALHLSGKYEEARSHADRALERSQALNYKPLVAEATFALGKAQAELGEYDLAAKTIAEASWLAEGSRHDELAAEAQVTVAGIYGFRLQRMNEALTWSRHAESIIDHLSSGESLQASLWSALGNSYFFQAEFDKASEYQERALNIFIRVKGPDDLLTGYAYNDLANAILPLDKFDESIEYLKRSLGILENRLGSHHPQVAMALMNLGMTLGDNGSFGDAKSYIQRGIERLESSLGPNHPYLGIAYNGLALAEDGVGNVDGAVAAFKHAVEIQERALGPHHPALFRFLMSFAHTLMNAGRYEEAEPLVNRATKVLDPSEQDTEAAIGLFLARGRLLSAQGRKAEALATFREARKAAESVPVALPASARQHILIELGHALRASGRTGEAVKVLEQAVAVEASSARLQYEMTVVARAHFELAQALWEKLDRASARDQAKKALEIYGNSEGLEDEAASVEAFLNQVEGSKRP